VVFVLIPKAGEGLRSRMDKMVQIFVNSCDAIYIN